MNSSLSQKKFTLTPKQTPNYSPIHLTKHHKSSNYPSYPSYSNYSKYNQHAAQSNSNSNTNSNHNSQSHFKVPKEELKQGGRLFVPRSPIKREFQMQRTDSSKNIGGNRRSSNLEEMVDNAYQTEKKIKNNSNFFTRTPNYSTAPTSEQKKQILCETSSTMKQLQNRGLVKKMSYYNSNVNKKKNTPNTRTSIMVDRKINGDSIDVIRPLGKGKYGSVFLVKEKHTGFLMALKVIEKKKIMESKLLDQFIRQIKIQIYLNHPGIVKLYGFFDDVENFYQLMQLGCDGQLYDRIQGQVTLSEQSASFVAKSLLNIVDYMHEKKVLHRDLKPENIVVVLGNLKICDFGWAVYNDTQMRTTFCGTPLYFSPQLLSKYQYDQKVDLWAIGIMTFQFVNGKSPFGLKKPQDISKIVTHQVQFPKNKTLSQQFKQFINLILQKDPQKRPTSKQLLQTSFIRHYSDLEVCEELCRGRRVVGNQQNVQNVQNVQNLSNLSNLSNLQRQRQKEKEKDRIIVSKNKCQKVKISQFKKYQ